MFFARIVCYEPEDGLFGGVPAATGEWVGILGDVHRGKAALGIAYYAYSVDRREAFQPSYSLEKLQLVTTSLPQTPLIIA